MLIFAPDHERIELSGQALAASERVRWRSLHLFNMFRLVLAGLFLVAGAELGLGSEAPVVFGLVVLVYVAIAFSLGFRRISAMLGMARTVALLFTTDVLALSLMMWASGGYGSGIPVLIMVMLAGASLVAEGRMVLFFAALATLLMLGENSWRMLVLKESVDFLKVGFWCIGFFGVAIVARLLASRAHANALLAAERGEALIRQQAVNERIIADMEDGVVVASSEGVVQQANPQAAALLGLGNNGGSGLEGLRLDDLDPAFATLLIKPAQEENRHRLLRLGPGGRLLRCRMVNGDDHAGKEASILIYLTDFEDIQRNVQRDKLAALGRLTASMAHEIRNPLSAVSQAAELLRDEKRAAMQARLARIINDNAQRIERMIRDVLALGRREQTWPEEVPLAEFVDEVLDERIFRDGAEAGRYDVDVDPDLSLMIDRAHLHQILDNLLANASRHGTGAPAAVRIHAHALSGERVALHVHDDGPGLEESTRQQVFEPFFTTHAKGTGLGLYIARELAEANDATLELAASEQGADFVLCGRQKS